MIEKHELLFFAICSAETDTLAANENPSTDDADDANTDEVDMKKPAIIPETIQEEGTEFKIPVSSIKYVNRPRTRFPESECI